MMTALAPEALGVGGTLLLGAVGVLKDWEPGKKFELPSFIPSTERVAK